MVTTNEQIESTRRWPVFQMWVHLARTTQNGVLTQEQYAILESEFLRIREPVSWPLFGWGWGSMAILRRALADEDVRVQ
jgi:hypothetical protein